ncbi:MAG: methionine--tRNA ligase [Alphaproteobacteria bacterium]|jgi:methionyl-tRNA synthetase|nr:methionine--tRNA ligase [Alphaproteobacteria bacterium]
MKKEKILVTSALPYVNGAQHLGHLVGCWLPSDIYARFKRAQGNEVLYVCGADEYGTPTEVGAEKEGMEIKDYCDKYYALQTKFVEAFNLSLDHYGRTATEKHTELVQKIFKELHEAGFMKEKEIEQVYSIDDKRFLADRYVEGTCPKCGYEKARGDQCDGCCELMNAAELINPYSTISGSTNIEVRKTKHIFLALEDMQHFVDKWIGTRTGWHKTALGIANKWLKEGLHDRCITRDLKWGVPIPLDGYEGKVFYVWFDAPWGYVSISQEWAEKTGGNWEKFWLEDDTKYVQFMGKDNVPFHSVFFPAEELAAKDNWKTVDILKGSNFLNFAGGKFSKSYGNGFSALDAVEEYPADYWRYWTIANYPENDDSEFSFDKFAEQINKDLNDVLGNFVLRVMKFCRSKFGEVVPEGNGATEVEEKLFATLETKVKEYNEHLENVEFRKAMSSLREIWSEGNEYIASAAPWTEFKTNPERAGEIIKTSLNLIRLFANLAAPIMPTISKQILSFVSTEENNVWCDDSVAEYLSTLKSGDEIRVPDSLFEKITDERVEELKEKYSA